MGEADPGASFTEKDAWAESTPPRTPECDPYHLTMFGVVLLYLLEDLT